jgi:transcriptional regulator with XRE-family HTH domain
VVTPKRATRSKAAARRPTAVDHIVGRLIRERRLELAMNLQQLSELVGIAVQQLQKYETGENRVSVSRLVEIARHLNVPVAWFFDKAGSSNGTTAGATRAASDLINIFDDLSPENQRKLIEIARLLRQ